MCPALRGFTGLLLTRISSPGFQVPGSDRTRSMMLATCAAEPVLSGETKKPPITERPLMTLQQRSFDECRSEPKKHHCQAACRLAYIAGESHRVAPQLCGGNACSTSEHPLPTYHEPFLMGE